MVMRKDNTPDHVAIIMDGNGRWAKKKGLPRISGHKAGVDALKKTVEACIDIGIKYLTVFSFSTENWNRPEKEIKSLMELFVVALNSEIDSMFKNGVRLRIIGDEENIPKNVLDTFKKGEELTKGNKKLFFNIALNYGSRQELLNAFLKIIKRHSEGKIELERIDINKISDFLYTKDCPDPDLLIRTSGEYRISNFLLWQIAYSELFFTEALWPDFDKSELLKAVNEYKKRNRRFGRI